MVFGTAWRSRKRPPSLRKAIGQRAIREAEFASGLIELAGFHGRFLSLYSTKVAISYEMVKWCVGESGILGGRWVLSEFSPQCPKSPE